MNRPAQNVVSLFDLEKPSWFTWPFFFWTKQFQAELNATCWGPNKTSEGLWWKACKSLCIRKYKSSIFVSYFSEIYLGAHEDVKYSLFWRTPTNVQNDMKVSPLQTKVANFFYSGIAPWDFLVGQLNDIHAYQILCGEVIVALGAEFWRNYRPMERATMTRKHFKFLVFFFMSYNFGSLQHIWFKWSAH